MQPSGKGFGAATSLHLESTSDICALLTSYLSALSEPILPPSLFEPVWELCGIQRQHQPNIPDLQQNQEDLCYPTRLSSIPLARSYTPPSETTYILVAQRLLHLLPSPNFSLLIYLLAFFSQVALVREENGVGVEDLSRMFGARIFGYGQHVMPSPKYDPVSVLESPSSTTMVKGKEKQRNGQGEVMMVWFLRRWGPISESLFDIIDDTQIRDQNRIRIQEDGIRKDPSVSAYAAARDALTQVIEHKDKVGYAHVVGEKDQKVDGTVERGLLEDGDMSRNEGIPEPLILARTPTTVHPPVPQEDVEEYCIPFLMTKGFEPVRNGTFKTGDNRSESPPASSQSSTSTLPQYSPYYPPLDSSRLSNPDHTDIAHLWSPTSAPVTSSMENDGGPEEVPYHSTPKKQIIHEDVRKGDSARIGQPASKNVEASSSNVESNFDDARKISVTRMELYYGMTEFSSPSHLNS